MMRQLICGLFFAVILLFIFLCQETLERENYAAYADLWEKQNVSIDPEVCKLWTQKFPQDFRGWFYLGRAFLEEYLTHGNPLAFELSDKAFTRSFSLCNDPRTSYWHSNLIQIRIFLGKDLRGFFEIWISLMNKTCALDPKNYYYYSVYFEKLMESVSLKPLQEFRDLITDQIAKMLGNYLRLKDFYQIRYLKMLEETFPEKEKKAIQTKLNIWLQS